MPVAKLIDFFDSFKKPAFARKMRNSEQCIGHPRHRGYDDKRLFFKPTAHDFDGPDYGGGILDGCAPEFHYDHIFIRTALTHR